MVAQTAMQPFVRVLAIFLLLAGMSASVAGVRDARADGSPPSMSTAANVETDDARFQRLKAEGDRALAEKRLNDAIKAYDAAREIRRDPLTAGRMGLAISFFDDPRAFVDAAGMLYEAVADAAGATSQEKDAFFAAYKRVRKKVCKLSIDTNDANARIDLGDGHQPEHVSFFVFVKQGKGEGVAKLEGRADIRKTWDCKGDQDIELRFDFPARLAPTAETKTVEKETVKVVYVPITSKNANTKPTNTQKPFTLSVGPGIVFGASPALSFGLSLGGNYSFGDFSAMLTARGGWSSTYIGNANVNSFVLTAMGGPCIRRKWFDACLAPSITFLQHRFDENSHYLGQTNSRVIPGLGVAMGVTRQISSAFALRLSGDVSVLSGTTSFTRNASNTFVQTWDGGRLLGGLTVTATLSP
jgi:hypothetical protein